MIIAFALSGGVALAQGPMTNGATHTGLIQIGGLDTWTFEATQNESISLSIGEVAGGGADPLFGPWIRLRGQDGAPLGSDWGVNAAQIDVRAPLDGTYTVLVASNPGSQVGPGSYVLTLAKTPGPYTASAGDEGGPMTNGALHPGWIGLGDLDAWTFPATQNDSITLGIGEVMGVGADALFSPWIRLRGPDGASLGTDWGLNAAQIDVRAALTGIYTVLVASNPGSQVGPGSYVLTLAKTPGPYTRTPVPDTKPPVPGTKPPVPGTKTLVPGIVSAGEQGGQITSIGATPSAPPAQAKHVRAVRIPSGRITVDGKLTEAEWAQAQPATDFLQQQPSEGAPTTESSEFRFLYDDRNLYVGGTFDSDPRRIIVNELKRDFTGVRDGDLIAVAMDTFLDKRTSYSFTTNAGGALRELQSSDDGRISNTSWDAIWDVRVSTDQRPWTMEMVIPFKSVRFPKAEEQTWGLNIQRVIRYKNEATMWTAIPRQFGPFKVSYGGLLEGISGVSPGRNIRVKPFGIGSLSSRLGKRTGDADGGLDVKVGLGTSLVLDGSFRTDFSQVEADEQQVNLTRFNLFFPEKREFFLENQDAFNIGPVAGGSNRNDLVPFFSRSIGLNETGDPIPMLGGLRLTGRVGRNNVGLLNTQTEQDHLPGKPARPASNVSVLRYGRNFWSGSKISGFYMDKEQGGASNRLVGSDLRIITRKLDVDALLMRSTKTEVGSGIAWRTGAIYDSNVTRYAVSYTSLGGLFRDDLGFIPRQNVDILTGDLQRRFRPKATYGWIREYRPQLQYDRFSKNGLGVETEMIGPTFNVDFADGSGFSLSGRNNSEVLTNPFRVQTGASNGVSIAPGTYEYQDGDVDFSSSRARRVSLNGTLRFGEFWNGSRLGYTAGGRVRFSRKLATTLSYGRDDVTLPTGAFSTNLITLRVDGSFSPRMFLNAFIQYNSVTHLVVSNVRYNVTHHPLSDLYIVYNETRPTVSGQQASRALILKLTHSLSF